MIKASFHHNVRWCRGSATLVIGSEAAFTS
jgi:hypothetical protein